MPVQLPFVAVSVCPTVADPETVGREVATGPGAASATGTAVTRPAAAATSAAESALVMEPLKKPGTITTS